MYLHSLGRTGVKWVETDMPYRKECREWENKHYGTFFFLCVLGHLAEVEM